MEKIKMKKCVKCKKEKIADVTNFYKDARAKDGLGSWCIECQRENQKEIANKAKDKKENKKFKTGGIVPKKQGAVMFFPGALKLDATKILTLNFSEHEDLFKRIEAAAKQNFRTTEMQVMWTLAMDVRSLKQGE